MIETPSLSPAPVAAPPRPTANPPAPVDREALVQSYLRAFQPVTDEVDATLRVAEGTLPPELRGVLYRNGPGRLERGGRRYGHPFDGDGMVTRFAFGGGRVRYRNRFVRTAEFCAEQRADRILYRGFGTQRPGGLLSNALRLRFKNAANTSVLFHGGKLLALWEGGLPHQLDPETLDTIGPYDYRGQLRNPGGWLDRWLAPELSFSAHPRLDPRSGELWSFGMLLGKESRLALYRVDAKGRMDAPTLLPVPQMSFVHDFVLTERHRVFFLYPAAFDVARSLLGLSSPAGSLRAVPGAPTRVLVVPRDGGAPWQAEAPSCFLFHFSGGHDRDDGRVVALGLRMAEQPETPDGQPVEELLRRRYPAPILTRFTIERGAGGGTGVVTEEPLTDHPGELPSVHPAHALGHHRYVYLAGALPGEDRPLYTRVLRVDAQERQTLSRELGPDLPGEPLFVPRPGASDEDDGWLLVMAYVSAAHRSDLLILSARDLSTLCRLELPHHVPPGFHGTFVPASR